MTQLQLLDRDRIAETIFTEAISKATNLGGTPPDLLIKDLTLAANISLLAANIFCQEANNTPMTVKEPTK